MQVMIGSAVCDVHPSTPLGSKTITLGPKYASFEEGAWCCQDPECNRCYSSQRGYYTAREGEFIDQGIPRTKPQCIHDSQPVYWIVMLKDGELVWACPEGNCQATRPYQTQP